uniref:Putative sodium-coupled neutral amino acid transporter 11 n=1 Tax=Myxobolus squamalis TaxID=59785 RepID=A0A6B2G6K3_MYXSQ
MKDRSIEKLLVAKNIAFFISYIIYIVVAGCGFITFGGQPQQNLFVGYCSNDILINITRLVFTITILLTSPIQLHGCREVIESQFFSKYSKNKFVGPFIIFFLVSVVFIISSLIDDVGTVIEVGGAITNVPLVYILPALCAIFMYKKNGNEIIWKKIMAWTILLFGLFMLVISPYFSVQSYVEKFNHLPIEKYYCNKD